MDYQSLFTRNIYNGKGPHLQRGTSNRLGQPTRHNPPFYSPEEKLTISHPVREILFRHSEGCSSVLVDDDFFRAEDIDEGKIRVQDEGEHARLRLLIAPPRLERKDAHGRPTQYNPEAPNPFDDPTFHRFVDAFQFHKACLSTRELGQVSSISSPSGITSFYIENLSYREGWYKVSIAYDPALMSTSVYLHNFEMHESRTICDRLLSEPLHPLTLHPMLVPMLVFELIFEICIKELERLFISSIQIQHTLGLSNYKLFEHFKDIQLDNDAAAKSSFGDGQSLCALEEHFDFSIMMGKKLLSYFENLNKVTNAEQHKPAFENAGSIIYNRLDYLVSALELQLPRLRRTQAHTQLNRTGLESRTATLGNNINHQIALESKADSSAMKAIAVLTMIFLPGTFVASFFAMPLFDWDAETQSGVVKNRFWIYWVVTVPGTVAVLVVWRLWWVFYLLESA
ncbi:hypothetical protein LSUB1_G003808 [Lachnellula subtilissima]|uniref:Uncharacterized protein n=1 Tax=Lachnellula subtilissima TaxID=602034 RepID=A0A8H8RSL7_9HELO|nr:hypothetical protein LSUB1_G003808 [Lachnellula subtilissima]